MLNLARDRRDIKVVDDQRGTPTSTAQLARAVEAVMHSGKYGIYHATCEGSCTWYEFACKIFKTTGLAVNLTPCTSAEFTGKAPRPAYSVLKNTNLRDNTGLVLSHWKDALHEYLKGETI
jgi:dTDP-4-dehydrorhamnose reductase